MKRVWRENGLTIAFALMFIFTLFVGQSWTGMRTYNADQKEHGEKSLTYPQYLTSAHFGEATFENWESEFLQMGSFVLLTIWLRQRGSSESKEMDGESDVDEDPEKHRNDPNAPWPVRRGGLALALYRRSLTIAFFALFFASFAMHLLTGARNYNNEQLAHGQPAVSTLTFLRSAEFWFQSLQNWQSEFLAVASLVVLSIFLRQQGSSESKPVHMPHAEQPAA
jgi:hypothetical protein